MLALSYYQTTAFNIAQIPEQWRDKVTVVRLGVVGVGLRYRVTINVQPDDSSYRYRALMQKPQLVLKFSLPFYIEFPVGTTCTFQNQVFTLMRAQDLKKQGTRKIEYSMTLGTHEEYFSVWKLRNVVDPLKSGDKDVEMPKDNRLKFSYCAKPHEFIDLLVRNLNKKDRDFTWSRGDCIEASEKTVEFNHTYIDAALNDIANAFETEYEIEYTSYNRAKIHLKRVEYFKTQPVALSYGVGNGFVPGVGRTTEADGVPVKRMFVQGSDRNIDRAQYGSPELLLPKSQSIRYDGEHFEDEDGFNADIAHTYTSDADGEGVERTDVVSTATKEDSLDCSEIYPARYGTVSYVKCTNSDKQFWDVADNTITSDLNYNSCLIAGETMTIIFQDGMLAGKEFDCKYVHEAKGDKPARRFEIVPQEIDGIIMPNETFAPKEGQQYAIFGIQLPPQYICNDTDKSGASWKMMRAAVKALYEAEEQKFTFSGQLQALWAKRHWDEVGGYLVVGGHVLFTDAQFAKDGQVIRIVGIKDFLTDPYSPTLELSNGVASGSSVSAQLREIDNTEVVIEDTKKSLMQFTKRRFRDALETIGMLDDAQLGDFSGSVSPVAVQTMAMLVGDESLQFRFAYREERTDEDGNKYYVYSPTKEVIAFDNGKMQLFCTMQSGGMQVCLQHMTIGQNAIVTQERRDAQGYVTWPMQSFTSRVLSEPSRSYYVYARVSSTNTNEAGTFVLSEKSIRMEQENGYFHLLVGVINSEIEGHRSFVTLYGFTEILPGRITTDLLVSNDGKTYIDLEKGEIGGAIKFLADDGYITLIEGGKIKTELIDVSELIARSVIVGEPDKQRIEIKPNNEGNGSVKIFDENDNEVSVFEGQAYDSINDLYGGGNLGDDCTILNRTKTQFGYAKDVTLGRGNIKQTATEANDYVNESIRISKVWKTDTPTEVIFDHGYLYAYAYSAGYTENRNSDQSAPLPYLQQSSAMAQVRISVNTYANYDEATDALSTLKNSMSVAIAASSASASMKSSVDYGYDNGYINPDDTGLGVMPNRPSTGVNSSTTVTWQSDSGPVSTVDMFAKNVKVRVPAGYHVIVLSLSASAYHDGSYAQITWGFTSGSRSDIAAHWKCDFYVSRFFANGFCLGTRADNYVLVHKTADGMRLVMENNDLGFDFSKTGIRTRAKGQQWMPLPMLIYKDAFIYSDNVYSRNTSHGCRSFNNEYVTAERLEKGRVKLTFPTSWATALGTISQQNLLVQVNAYHSVIDARIESVSTTNIIVAMSDDASRNDGNFNIVIYYLAS